jgi:hypothetical protein
MRALVALVALCFFASGFLLGRMDKARECVEVGTQEVVIS